MQLTQNVGTVDRLARVVLAAALFALALAGIPGTPLLWVEVAVAAILGATAIAGFCPLYAVLRLSTRAIRR